LNLKFNTVGFISFSDDFDIRNALPADAITGWGVVINALRHKLTHGIIRHVNGDIFSSIAATANPAEPVCWQDHFDKVTALKENNKANKRTTLEEAFGLLETAEDDRFIYTPSGANSVELYYLQRMRLLAAQNGMRLYVSRPWGYKEPPLSSGALERIRALVPEFIYPPQRFVRENNDAFADHTHMGPGARAAHTRWLLGEILKDERSHAARI
jgi:hypothetical protein